jgi:hypothetical protein
MPEENGFFDFLGDVGTLVGFTTNPVGTTMNLLGGEIAQSKSQQVERSENQMNPFELQSRNARMASNTANMGGNDGGSFLGGLGQTIGGFGRDIGGFVQDISPLTSLFGIGTPAPSSSGGSARTLQRMGAEETSDSGQILGANLGLAPTIFNAGRNFLRTPGGQTALGFGAGAVGSALMGGGDGKVRITRRMKSDVRKIYMMAGMDPNATAQILNNLGTYPRMRFDASLVFFILTKRFRNDGAVVTKAAVRKTKTTLRRMKGVVDMYNSVCKPTTRRAPARRAAPKAVQLIKN